jgi:hypothetical protein
MDLKSTRDIMSAYAHQSVPDLSRLFASPSLPYQNPSHPSLLSHAGKFPRGIYDHGIDVVGVASLILLDTLNPKSHPALVSSLTSVIREHYSISLACSVAFVN